MMWERGIPPRSGVLIFIVTIVCLCHARSPTPCEIRKEDEDGQHVWCYSVRKFTTIISYLRQVHSAPAYLRIGTSPELVLTKVGFQNPVFNNLLQLGLVQNQITEFNPEVLTGLPNLRRLYLYSNNISRIDENTFAGLDLNVLLLKDNQITNIAEGTFRNLPHLSELSLSINNLTELPATLFQGLTHLNDLELDENLLTNLDENLFQGLGNVNTLNLAHNKITNLRPNVLKPLTRITALDLSHNRLEAIDINQFESNAQLAHLDLSSNNFSNLSHAVLSINSLKELIAQNNNISELRLEYFSLPNLVVFNLGNNQFKIVQTSIFDTVKKLKFVYLGGNDLTAFMTDTNGLQCSVDSFRTEISNPRNYTVITSNHPVDCSLPYYKDTIQWFDDNNYNYDKVFSCQY